MSLTATPLHHTLTRRTWQVIRGIPPHLRQCDWYMTFSSAQNGFNINTFYRNFRDVEERPCVLVVQDMNKRVSGCGEGS